MQDKICMHFWVSGKVQGVWFRKGAQDKAQELGVVGWARNLPDGRVEVMACGDKERVMLLFQWLKVGTEMACVDDVVSEEVSWEEFDRFGVR